MKKYGFGLSVLFSSMLMLGACASKTQDVASNEGKTCCADCKHEKGACKDANCNHETCKKGCHASTGEKCEKHADHAHAHGKDCGHKTVQHKGHTDYIHDGHQHNPHGDHVDEHKQLKASATDTQTNS